MRDDDVVVVVDDVVDVRWMEWLDLCRCILAVKAPDANEWAESV